LSAAGSASQAQTFYDIALRDFGLAVCAFAFGRLAMLFDPPLGARV
jgi:hypothetical protein